MEIFCLVKTAKPLVLHIHCQISILKLCKNKKKSDKISQWQKIFRL